MKTYDSTWPSTVHLYGCFYGCDTGCDGFGAFEGPDFEGQLSFSWDIPEDEQEAREMFEIPDHVKVVFKPGRLEI